jgi:hypothetical protein
MLNKPNLNNQIVWFKDDKELDFNDENLKKHYCLESEKKTYSLIIKNCSFDCAGEYSAKLLKQGLVSKANLVVEGKTIDFLKICLGLPFYNQNF